MAAARIKQIAAVFRMLCKISIFLSSVIKFGIILSLISRYDFCRNFLLFFTICLSNAESKVAL